MICEGSHHRETAPGSVGVRGSNPLRTVTSSIQTGLKITATASGNTSFDLNILVAGAKAQFQLQIAVEATISSTWTYTHTITSNKYGCLQLGTGAM